MSGKRGCFKNGCLGCLGLLVLVTVLLLVGVLVAKNSTDSSNMVDRWLVATNSNSEPIESAAEPSPAGHLKAGRVILNLSQGEFQIRPAKSGEPLSVKAVYDSENYHIEENYQVMPDSTWVYELDYYRTQAGLMAFFQALTGNGGDSRIIVYLPVDVPLDLELRIQEGGMESEWAGLWINDADLVIGKGGFVISVSEPLKEPMGKLELRGSMGGLVVSELGNASPSSLDVNWSMGGGDVDLNGQWVNDCDIKLTASMGGMDVRVPDDVRTTGAPGLADLPLAEAQEIPQPVLRFNIETSMGGFEISR